jgi:predicted nucleic acid-binding protein
MLLSLDPQSVCQQEIINKLLKSHAHYTQIYCYDAACIYIHSAERLSNKLASEGVMHG